MLERRYSSQEIRSDDKYFRGYVAMFHDPRDPGTEYQLKGDLWERIESTAFERSIRSGKDIRCHYNHNNDAILGRTSAKTLKLWTDEKGLMFEMEYQGDDPDHRRAKSKICSGSATGASFGFYSRGKKFVKEKGRAFHVLTDVDLDEVSIAVATPAYNSPNTSFRSEGIDENISLEYALWQETQLRYERLAKIFP